MEAILYFAAKMGRSDGGDSLFCWGDFPETVHILMNRVDI